MFAIHRALIGYAELASLRRGAYVWNPFRVAAFSRVDLEPFRDAGARDLETAPDRLARGDRSWGLWEGEALLAYGWTTGQPTAFRDLFEIRPGPGEAYFYDYFTHPDHRGRGCYPLLLAGIANVLAAEGRQAAWIAVSEANTSSWRGVHKAGFRHAGDVYTLRRRLGVVVQRGEQPRPPVRLRARGLLVTTARQAA